MGLKKKTIFGVLWNTFELLSGKVIQIIITIILARILIPEDFGIIALLVIFTELSKVILDSGFSQALIRKQDATQEDFTSIFYFNIFIGLLIYLFLYFISPQISNFYNYPELTNIARVIFLTIIINSFGIVQNALVVKSINFKILAKRTIIANFIGGVVAVSLAYLGFAVWALVFQILIATLLRVILLWLYSNWRPSKSFTIKPIKELFSFSSNLLLSGIFDVIASNIQTLLIGKFYSQASLGFYSQAKLLANLPSQTLTSVIRNVTYPTLSEINNKNTLQLKNSYRRIIKIAIFIIFPIMLGFIAIGDRLIPLVLGDKWIPSIEYFMLFCLIGAIYPLYSISQNIFLVQGNSKLFLKVSIAKRVITLIGILITIQFGVLTLVIGQVVTTVINTILTMYFSGKEIDYSLKEQIKDIIGIILISLFMLLTIYIFGVKVHFESSSLVILSQICIGIVVYFTLSFIFKLSVIFELKNILLSIKK